MAKKRLHYYRFHPVEGGFRVSKLDEDFEFQGSYTVTLGFNAKQHRCDCPAYKRPCKHVTMVKKHLANGAPASVVFNGVSGEFEECLMEM